MDPQLIARLKSEYVQRRPTIAFETANDGYVGDGSFSITFAARDGQVPCVVKFSKKPWAQDKGVEKERRALLDLMLQCNGHPHVVALHYYDDNFDGHLITQWEKGDMSLEQRLQACRANGEPGIPRDELLLYMEQAAKGLDFVNGKGIVHRDVKPENLLLFQGQVKLIDFGFARLAEIDSVTNSVHGTPVYAPAEASDGWLNPSVDIYCLAGTFIRLRTGEYPFGTGDDLKNRKLAGQFHTAGLRPHAIATLRGALDPDPKRRAYATAGEFVKALFVQPPAIMFCEKNSQQIPPELTTASDLPSELPTGKFHDIIRGIVIKEQAKEQAKEEVKTAKMKAAREQQDQRQAALRQQFEALLQQQLDSCDFALAYGTAKWLLHDDFLLHRATGNSEFQDVLNFLEQPDGRGNPRAEDPAGIRLALVPPGEIWIEDHFEGPVLIRKHRVSIKQPVYMGINRVNDAQFRRFKRAKKSDDSDDWNYPISVQSSSFRVENVLHYEAVEFCHWLAKLTGKLYRLPNFEQWEYAFLRSESTLERTGYGGGRIKGPISALADLEFIEWDNAKTDEGSDYSNEFDLFECRENIWGRSCFSWVSKLSDIFGGPTPKLGFRVVVVFR